MMEHQRREFLAKDREELLESLGSDPGGTLDPPRNRCLPGLATHDSREIAYQRDAWVATIEEFSR